MLPYLGRTSLSVQLGSLSWNMRPSVVDRRILGFLIFQTLRHRILPESEEFGFLSGIGNVLYQAQ